LTVIQINLQNKNSQKTSYQLSTSTVVNKWEKEVTKPSKELKMLKVKLKPSLQQKKIFHEWFDTTHYVYNKALECIKKGHNPCDKQGLRNILVTNKTRISNPEYSMLKSQQTQFEKTKNEMNREKKNTYEIEQKIKELKQQIKNLPVHKNAIQEWELNTPKEIRASIIDDLITAHKSGFTNLKNGNIKYFNVDYKKKDMNRRCCSLPKTFVKNVKGKLRIAPSFFKGVSCNFEMGRRTKKKFEDLEIEHDCKLLKDENRYWILIPVSLMIKPREKPINYCGIDPGSRTFMTTFGNKGCFEYEHNKHSINRIDKKIKEKLKRTTRKRIRKNTLRRLEYKKKNYVDEIHWKTIIKLLKENDVLFYGDIKSHDIVKNGKNKTLNRDLNNLKMFKFKSRLMYKTKEWNKLLFILPEEYTTRTCSCCGTLNDPECSKTYYCKKCNIHMGRDVNASKNILMKGIKTFL
jgi:putative transposase